MVKPSVLETRTRKKSSKTTQLNGKRAQRIPSWPGVLSPTKAVYICADQPVNSLFACGRAADHTFRVARDPGATRNVCSGLEIAVSLRGLIIHRIWLMPCAEASIRWPATATRHLGRCPRPQRSFQECGKQCRRGEGRSFAPQVTACPGCGRTTSSVLLQIPVAAHHALWAQLVDSTKFYSRERICLDEGRTVTRR
jgi:hypothetical protein